MQTYLKNGYVVSMNQTDNVFDGGGVLVEDDRIVAVGKVDPKLLKADAEVIDLQGKYVLPGFVNTHVHTSQQISRGVGDDVDFICWLHDRMWPFESNMTEEDSYVSTLMTSLELIRSGVTSFAEPGGQFVSGMARATAQSGLRGKLAKSVMDCGEGLPAIWQRTMEQELEQQVLDLENTITRRTAAYRFGSACAPFLITRTSFASARKNLPTNTASVFICMLPRLRKKRNTPTPGGVRERSSIWSVSAFWIKTFWQCTPSG